MKKMLKLEFFTFKWINSGDVSDQQPPAAKLYKQFSFRNLGTKFQNRCMVVPFSDFIAPLANVLILSSCDSVMGASILTSNIP